MAQGETAEGRKRSASGHERRGSKDHELEGEEVRTMRYKRRLSGTKERQQNIAQKPQKRSGTSADFGGENALAASRPSDAEGGEESRFTKQST